MTATLTPGGASPAVAMIADIDWAAPSALLARFGLELVEVEPGEAIPGSYWGDTEAGIIGTRVYARADTPLHSLLHEAGHLMVMPPGRRAGVHTDAADTQRDEDAVCYLQLLLADELPGFGRQRALADMDAWGYRFRLGSAQAWFEGDAEDAATYLAALPHLAGLLPALPGTGRPAARACTPAAAAGLEDHPPTSPTFRPR